jgi:hypothetical protein
MVDLSTGRTGQENDGYQSPLWVISCRGSAIWQCPFHPRKQTLDGSCRTSAFGHGRAEGEDWTTALWGHWDPHHSSVLVNARQSESDCGPEALTLFAL